MKISIIVAFDRNNLIGNKNKLPWHFKTDLKFFKETTLNKTILMGRKCFESIGKKLLNRRNLILSRTLNDSIEEIEVYSDIVELLNYLKLTMLEDEELFIIGGSEIYRQFLNIADFLYITEIDFEYNGDCWFPKIDYSELNLISKNIEFENDIKLTFNKYSKSLFI